MSSKYIYIVYIRYHIYSYREKPYYINFSASQSLDSKSLYFSDNLELDAQISA